MYCDDPLLGNWNFLVWMMVLIWITIYSTLAAEFEMTDIKRDHCSEIINLSEISTSLVIDTIADEFEPVFWQASFLTAWASHFNIHDIDTPLYFEMILLLSFIRQEDIIWQYHILEITKWDTHYEQPVLKKQIFKL